VLSAVWLAGASSPLARAAVDDALARTARLDTRAAVPARRPSGTRGLAFGAAVLAVAWLVPVGTGAAARLPAPRPARPAAAPLAPAVLEAERAAVALAKASGDAALRALAATLDRLVRGLGDGTLDQGAALEALRVLNEQAGASAASAARDAQALRAAAKALVANPATRDAGQALRREPPGGADAASALGSSAARQPAATSAGLRAAAEAVSQAATAASDQESAARRRLRRDVPGASGSGAAAERDHGDEPRKLEQLSRDLDQAGASCAQGGPDCRSRAEAGGRQLGDVQRQAAAEPALRDLERATRQLHERIARGELRNGESDAARAFAQAAAGGQAAPSPSEAPGAAGGSSDERPNPGRPQAAGAGSEGVGMGVPGGAPAGQATQAGADDEQSAAGGGIGHENGGAPLAGRDSPPAPPGRDARVPTAEGAGPSRAQVIDGAAGRGFASRPYARVFADYQAAVEDAMGASAVPPGQQYVVRRYFDLIRPRPSAGAGRRP
jgi:trimeric autotransporter adhesin